MYDLCSLNFEPPVDWVIFLLLQYVLFIDTLPLLKTRLPTPSNGYLRCLRKARQVDSSLRSNGGAFSGVALRHGGSRAGAAAGAGMSRSSCEGVSMSASTGTAKVRPKRSLEPQPQL